MKKVNNHNNRLDGLKDDINSSEVNNSVQSEQSIKIRDSDNIRTTTKPFYNSTIPSDWEVMEFGEFTETEKGKYIPVENEDLCCLELEHFEQGTGHILGCVKSSEQKSTKNKFKKGQVLFGKLRPYLQKYWLAEYDGVCSSEVWVLNSKNKKCSNEFLFRLVQTNRFIQVANVSSGSKMPRADWDYVSTFPFTLPPLPEQKAIAYILSLMDTAINQNNLLIAKKELQKKWLMQNLLTGKKRLGKTGSKQGEVGSWKEVKLGDIGKFSKGKGILKEQVLESGLPCIRYGEIYTTHDFIIKKFNSFINENIAKDSHPIKTGDILFAGSGETLEEIGKAVAYIGNEKAFAGGDVIILSTNGKTNAECLSFLLETNFVNRQKRKFGQGHSVVHIYPSDLAEIKIFLPSLEEQTAIAQVLQAADKEIQLLKAKTEKLREEKKGLMQVLLTGKKRLKIN